MGFFILMFFGVGAWCTYMMFRSFTGDDSGRRYEDRYYDDSEDFDDDVDVNDLDTFDKVECAYNRGKIDMGDLQSLYDSGTIDEIEAESIDPDAVDFDDE